MCMHIFRQITIYIVPLISIENKCLYDAIQDLKCEKKKFGERRDWIEPGSIASKRQNETQFIICTTGADVYIDCSSSRSSYTSWLTDVSSSQRGVIYSYIYIYVYGCSRLTITCTIKVPREQNETSRRSQMLQLLKIGCESHDDDTLYSHWSDSVMTSTRCVACSF